MNKLEIQMEIEQNFHEFYTQILSELPKLKSKYPQIETDEFRNLLQVFYAAGSVHEKELLTSIQEDAEEVIPNVNRIALRS